MILYNTLSRKKEKFVPIKPPQVRMYVCGPTVYNLLHIGNFRGAVVYNCLKLWLEYLGFKVSYYYNLTDIDDKIIKKAQEEGSTAKKIADTYVKEFFKDFKDLKLQPHDGNPKATESIPAMIELISDLIQKGVAYESEGNVFYSVRNFKRYGHLSHRKLDDLLESGSNEEVTPSKKDPLDFTLWKKAKEGEPYWGSPWGQGRPGWHIECTAMIHQCLGHQIDIHGGGMDLIFPHHENEIAQSEGVRATPFVKYWIHHNMFELEGRKMSKSLGNQKTMRIFLKEYNAEIFKYLVMNSHYRSVSEVSKKTVYQSIAGLYRIYQALEKAKELLSQKEAPSTQDSESFLKAIRQARSEMEQAMCDDLNTAKALASCFVLIRFFNNQVSKNKSFSQQSLTMFLEFFDFCGKIFSLFQEEPSSFLNDLDDILLKESSYDRQKIDQMIQERNQARQKKDFDKADRIRKELVDAGVDVQDVSQATKWRMNPGFFE